MMIVLCFEIIEVVENEETVTSTRLWKKYSNLERTEFGLVQTCVTIREAQKKNESLDDPDYVPRGPLYLNANVFHRYYKYANCSSMLINIIVLTALKALVKVLMIGNLAEVWSMEIL